MEHHVESKLIVNVSSDKAWEVLDDFSGIEKFSIGVEKSSLVGEKKTGLGAKRHCVFYDESSVIEEIIEYEENKGLKVVLTDFSMPMKSMYAGFAIKKITETSCEVSMYMDFVVKFGVFGSLLGALVMRPVMKGVQKKLLSGLAYYAFTGKTIGSKLPTSEDLSQAIG